MVTPAGGPRRRVGEEGYNLVVLTLIVLLMSVALSLALPAWSAQAKREKEQELIFRGLQYAEAVRVFQARHGRLPTTLEELVEVEPRSIRQLFPEPMSENGKWGLLVQSQTPRGQGRGRRGRGRGQQPNQQGQEGAAPGGGANAGAGGGEAGEAGAPGEGAQPDGGGAQAGGQQSGGSQAFPEGNAAVNPLLGGGGGNRMNVVKVPPSQGTEEGFGRRSNVTAGPIVGVYSAVDEESMILWNGQTNYVDWEFRADIIPTPVVIGGETPIQRANSGLIGRPWPEGLQPENVNQGGPRQGQNLNGGRNNRGNSRNRNPGRGQRNQRLRGNNP
ncbi:MAG: hypothetical protein AAGK22_15500 [Acidobacteriota bacterium]